MLKKLNNISITYKIHIPLIVISIIGLSIIIFNSLLSLDVLEENAKSDIQKELHSYVEDELDKIFEVELTNAINLSVNKEIINALQMNDREKAKNTLLQISEYFHKYSQLKDIKIHIHDKNKRSFLRSWNFNEYGDDLLEYRHSLRKIDKDKKPRVDVEVGRIGMVVRGIAPIFDEGVFIGSVEFIQDFNTLVSNAKSHRDYSIIVLSSEIGHQQIKKLHVNSLHVSDYLLLSQDYSITDKKFYKTIVKDYDEEGIVENELIRFGDYYVSATKLYNIEHEYIGLILVGANVEYVHRHVEQVKEIFIKQIWILVIVDILMLLILIYLLNITVRYPIFNLLKGIKKINSELNNAQKTPVQVYKECRLGNSVDDEMGVIAKTVNSLLETISKTFEKLHSSQKDTSEYIKAIYAGGLVSTSDTEGKITYVNDRFCEFSGYTKEELIGKPHSIFRDPSTPKGVYKKLWENIQSGNVYSCIIKSRKKNGEEFYSNTTIVPIKDSHNNIVEYIAFRDDITELIKSKEELKRTVMIHPLTSLGNRLKMLHDISSEHYLAILDVDFFREINDFYGHQIGDEVLKDLALRMLNYFELYKIEAYHLNGDEFAVMAQKNDISKDDFYKTIKGFLDLNKTQEILFNNETHISTRLTCGISYDGENIVTNADISHKHAKKIKKDIVEYTHEINSDKEYKKNLEWTSELNKAIKEDRIEAYFQPIVNAKTLKIEKYETLMRLIKDDGAEISPIHFLDIAKKTRVYKQLTKIIVKKAFERFKDTEYEFSINLSIEDIILHDVASWIFDLAEEKGVNNQLVIELVESEGIESFESINDFIKEAKEHGMKIAIDDFGTGYSNFEYLIKLNADYIKIDGSLMKDIDTNEKLFGVVETIVAFAKKNSIAIIGEYISSKDIHDKALFLEIDFLQGYYHGKPSKELLDEK